MRWNDLFGDLEAQLDAAQVAEFDAAVAELAEAERASVEFGSRLIASRGAEVSLALRDSSRVRGTVADAALQWALLEEASRQHLVPAAAIAFARGLSARAAEVGEVERRLPLGHALRALARDRAQVMVFTTGGVCAGAIASVGRDYLEVAEDGGRSVAVPFRQLACVTSA